MKFCVGDRVFANGKKTQGKYENTVNEVGTVKRIYKSGNNCYGVLFDNLTNIASEHGLYWFSEDEILEVKRMKKTNESKSISTKIKVGDKVRIKKDLPECEEVNGLFVNSTMYKYRGKEAIVTYVSIIENFQLNIKDCTSNWWNSEMVDLISEAPTNNIPTLSTIINEKHYCAIHTSNEAQVKKLFNRLTPDEDICKKALSCWGKYKEDTCYIITHDIYGMLSWTYRSESHLKADPDANTFTIYEFEDVYNRKENNNMFNIPSFKEIVDKEIKCIIHTPTKELAKVLFDNIKPYKPEYNWINFLDIYI